MRHSIRHGVRHVTVCNGGREGLSLRGGAEKRGNEGSHFSRQNDSQKVN